MTIAERRYTFLCLQLLVFVLMLMALRKPRLCVDDC